MRPIDKAMLVFSMFALCFIVWMGYEFVTHLNHQQTSCMITWGRECHNE